MDHGGGEGEVGTLSPGGGTGGGEGGEAQCNPKHCGSAWFLDAFSVVLPQKKIILEKWPPLRNFGFEHGHKLYAVLVSLNPRGTQSVFIVEN
jgi:hypothetical protein